MADGEVDRTVWVGNLPETVTEELLFELFLQAGPLQKVKLATDKDGRSKRYAFITFKHACSVPYTIDLMSGIQLFGSSLKLQTRTGSSHNSPNPSSQQSPVYTNYPQYSVSNNNTSPMTRGNTWHGKERYGRQNSEGSYNSRQTPSNIGGSILSPRNCDQLPLQGHSPDGNIDPLSLQLRRERVLQQQKVSLDAHRQRNYPPQNPYGNFQPWQQQQQQQQQRSYRRY
ncbi:RBM7 [Mytilus coruscus]|uniref:RBM7 n=1 Tax=Mytilus coruscus TaxID=42192 RepID=A0A6J8EYF5_MYTCO|nr:RBM7 [Mytilus coruscus]